MSRPGRLGLGLHGGPETRVRTVVAGPPAACAAPAPPEPAPVEIEEVKPALGPVTRSRRKTMPSDAPAPPGKPKKKLVVTLKIKSPALKKALEKRNMIKK